MATNVRLAVHLRIRRETLDGWLFAGPAILGFFILTLGPVLAALYFSFTEYSVIKPPVWVGLANYQRMFAADELFWQSAKVTLIYTLVSVPLSLVFGLLAALLMNQKIRGITLFRTIWYLPSIVPTVASAVLWLWVLNPDFGLLNQILDMVGIVGPRWFADPHWALWSLVVMQLWSVGGGMLIYLGGLQGVPQHLYEAVEIDGGMWWSKFWHVTLPMMTPIIFFNLVIGVINSFQVFTPAFVTTDGGPAYSTYFYVLHVYVNAFQQFNMGYSSAMGWFLLIVVLLFTLLIFRSSHWVYYEATGRRRGGSN